MRRLTCSNSLTFLTRSIRDAEMLAKLTRWSLSDTVTMASAAPVDGNGLIIRLLVLSLATGSTFNS